MNGSEDNIAKNIKFIQFLNLNIQTSNIIPELYNIRFNFNGHL